MVGRNFCVGVAAKGAVLIFLGVLPCALLLIFGCLCASKALATQSQPHAMSGIRKFVIATRHSVNRICNIAFEERHSQLGIRDIRKTAFAELHSQTAFADRMRHSQDCMRWIAFDEWHSQNGIQ